MNKLQEPKLVFTEEEKADYESICFDCGESNIEKVLYDGVALCKECYEIYIRAITGGEE